MSTDREAFMRMMGITSDDVADPEIKGKGPSRGSSSMRGGDAGMTGSASLTAKRRAFLEEIGLTESGAPLRQSPPAGTPPLAPPTRSSDPSAPAGPSSALNGKFSMASQRNAPIASSFTNSGAPGGNVGGRAADSVKAAGNDAFEAGNFLEAIKLYTQAIDLGAATGADANFMAALYSNRSASYLQGAKQFPSVESAYDHALCDADQAVALRPNWFKGYSRQGDAYFKSMHYHQAVEAYEMALQLQPGNENLFNSLRESRERAKTDSREQWQARRQARKQQLQRQGSMNASGTFQHSSGSVVSSSLGEPTTPVSLGYDDGATTHSSLNTTHSFGSTVKNARELWTELKAEVETTAQEQVTGDDYRKQQLEKYRQQREAKSKRLFGSANGDNSKANALSADSSTTTRNHGSIASAASSPKCKQDSKFSADRAGKEGRLGSGEHIGSQFIPEEFSSTAASAYQQRLLEQFRQRKTKA